MATRRKTTEQPEPEQPTKEPTPATVALPTLSDWTELRALADAGYRLMLGNLSNQGSRADIAQLAGSGNRVLELLDGEIAKHQPPTNN